MCFSRTSNEMNNRLHLRSIRILLNDYSSHFHELLESNNGMCKWKWKMQRELAAMMTESIVNRRVRNHNLRNFQEFVIDKEIIVCYGLETLIDRDPQLFFFLPETFKGSGSLSQFKRKIRH